MILDRKRSWVLAVWLVMVLAALAIIFSRLNFSYDLGLFLPGPQSLSQEVLVERLGDSPGSRYVLIAVPDNETQISDLITSLEELESIDEVLSDLTAETAGAIPEPVWSNRYLLADMDWSIEGLQTALRQRLSELGMGSDAAFEDMLRHDPALTALTALEPLAAGRDAAWLTSQGQRVLVAVTTAPAFDIEAQQRVVEGIRTALASNYPETESASLSGAGVFGVDLRNTIQQEATWRSVWASAALIVVLLLAYRSFSVIVLSALPLISALVLGLLGVTLAFGVVHGITLAFGFTLLGVAIDYPLHYFSHARYQLPEKAIGAVWPTLRLSAFSTVLAYLALLLGGAEGIAQLGLFSALGIAAALVTTRWVVPALARAKPPRSRPESRTRPPEAAVSLKIARWVSLVFAAALIVWQCFTPNWWSNDLSALSPIPAEKLKRDGELREAMGAPSMRYQVVIRQQDLESLLQENEALARVLQEASLEGLIDGFSSISSLLPSSAEQTKRQARIPAPDVLESRLAAAVESLPFTASAFNAFVQDSADSRDRMPLVISDYKDSPLADALLQFLIPPDEKESGSWTSLVTLHGEIEPRDLETLLEARMPEAELVDYRSASEELVADYRQRTGRVLAGVLLLIALVLLWQVRWNRSLVCVFVVGLSLLTTASLLRAQVGPLNLYHMMGLLLVAGIGLDYCLFLTRNETNSSDTRHAVLTCAASTVAAFGVLAASSIPALNSLGSAVACGVLICLLAAWLAPTVNSGKELPAV